MQKKAKSYEIIPCHWSRRLFQKCTGPRASEVQEVIRGMIGTLKTWTEKKWCSISRLFFRAICSETSYKSIHHSPCRLQSIYSDPIKPKRDGSIRPWWSSHRCKPLAYQRTIIEVESVWGGKFRTPTPHQLQHIKFLSSCWNMIDGQNPTKKRFGIQISMKPFSIKCLTYRNCCGIFCST